MAVTKMTLQTLVKDSLEEKYTDEAPFNIFSTLADSENTTPMPLVYSATHESDQEQRRLNLKLSALSASSSTSSQNMTIALKRKADYYLDSTSEQPYDVCLDKYSLPSKRKKSLESGTPEDETKSSISPKKSTSFSFIKNFLLKPRNESSALMQNPFVSIYNCVANRKPGFWKDVWRQRAGMDLDRPALSACRAPILGGLHLPNFLSASIPEVVGAPHSFVSLPELSSESLGGRIIFSTDDFYGSSSTMLKSAEPARKTNEFTHFGRFVDGWETQRRLQPLHDWCIIQLGIPGKVHGCVIDTSFFDGNQAPFVSVEAGNCPNLEEKIQQCYYEENCPVASYTQIGISQPSCLIERVNLLIQEQSMKESSQWRDLVPMSPLSPGCRNRSQSARHYFVATDNPLRKVTHLRLNLFPDGGLARFKAYGVAIPDLNNCMQTKPFLLSSVSNGGVVVSTSSTISSNPQNLIADTQPQNPSDCWETKRHINRRPFVNISIDTQMPRNLIGEEWVVLRLGTRCLITRIEIDTVHCLGNTPESILVRGVDITEGCLSCFDNIKAQQDLFTNTEVTTIDVASSQSKKLNLCWRVVISRTALRPGITHVFNQSAMKGQPSQPIQSRKKKTLKKKGSTTHARRGVDEISDSLSDSNKIVTSLDSETSQAQSEEYELENLSDPMTHLCLTIYPDGVKNQISKVLKNITQALSRVRVWGIPFGLKAESETTLD